MLRQSGLEDFPSAGYTSAPFLPFTPIFWNVGRADARRRYGTILSCQKRSDVAVVGRKPRTSALCRLGRLAVPALLFSCLCSPGCVQRRLTIRSNPPGALVMIDNHNIGITPCSTDYTYYGKRNIQLIRDGYETLNDSRWILPPWYEIPPIDFVSENAIPYELRDERIIDYQLMPQKVVPTQQLLGRAENLRQTTHLESVAPAASPRPFSGLFPASPAAPPAAAPGTWPLPVPTQTLPAPPPVSTPAPYSPPLSNVPAYSPPGGFSGPSRSLPPAGPR
jgi:hypothetical protein